MTYVCIVRQQNVHVMIVAMGTAMATETVTNGKHKKNEVSINKNTNDRWIV